MEKSTISKGMDRIRGLNSGNSLMSNITSDVTKKNPAIERLATGKYRIFWDYLERLGQSNDQNLIVLSPGHHYYYDYEDLKGVTTVLNLNQLNHIKEPGEFLKTINNMLSINSFFIGSFIDRKHQYSFFSNPIYPDNVSIGSVDPVENGISSRIPILNLIYDFIDSRINNRNLTNKSVTLMLEDSAFKVQDMTEINGITCFCSQKIA